MKPSIFMSLFVFLLLRVSSTAKISITASPGIISLSTLESLSNLISFKSVSSTSTLSTTSLKNKTDNSSTANTKNNSKEKTSIQSKITASAKTDTSVNSKTETKNKNKTAATTVTSTVTNSKNNKNNLNTLISKFLSKSSISTNKAVLSSITKNHIKSRTQNLISTKAKEDKSPLWSQLFTEEREIICRAKKQDNNTSQYKQQIKRGERIYKSNFIQKRWGYGATAYLIDYLDPVYKKDILTDFSKIWADIRAFPNVDNDVYEDVFDIKKLDPTNKVTDLKKLNPNYEPGVYESSVNSVQVDFAMKQWGWFKVDGEDNAKQFILDYDLGGDGRLNTREFFLGLIQHHLNKKLLCYNCLHLLKKKLSAMFEFLDCPGEGYIKAELLWSMLPQVQRSESKWNIFSIGNENSIRTDCINDFIIKNGLTKPGWISKEEFVNGILLAYWDRHVTDKGVVSDDSRSLKNLRWDGSGQRDLVAFEYMKEKELAEKLEQEERQKEKNMKATFKDKS